LGDLFDLQEYEGIRTETEFMRRADAVVFVVDSQTVRTYQSAGMVERLRDDLILLGRDPLAIPLVFQLNKRDLPSEEITPLEELKELHRWPFAAYVESIASQGIGVKEALDKVLELVWQRRATASGGA
jgi:predicted GTPase